MATVDDRVVSMAFENRKFESGVKGTISSLDKLKSALKFGDTSKGLAGISDAAKKTDLSHISRGVDSIKNKFGALRLVAIATLASIASKAVTSGAQFVKGLTFGPVLDGLREYENKINSVQTILSNTKAAGTTLKDVNKTLDELNKYADKTIYNFGQMTKNIGTFTAAGVDLETATTSIKGIANLAALSGSNAEQASTAMYQLSQAISAGRVSLQDWNSVVNAGMGGTVFQRALTQTAIKMGTLEESSVKLSGKMKTVTVDGEAFRQSISAGPGKESWLTSDVLTSTLSQLSGDMTDAQLKAEGFSDAQIKAIQSQAKMALEAATQVKTFTQLLDTTKEAIGSGWAETWQLIFGDFGEAKKLFTGLSDAIGGFVGRSADARNKVLKDWKDLGGRTLLINSIKNAFNALSDVVSPIKDAFRDIFPRKTGKDLFEFTKRINEFTKTLKPSPETVENLRRTFRGFFAILDIGKQILGGVWAGFKVLFGGLLSGAGSTLALSGNLGDLIVKLRDWLREGDKIKSVFEGLASVLSVPVKLTGQLSEALNNLFGGGDTGGAEAALSGMADAFTPAQVAAEAASDAWNGLMGILKKVQNFLQPTVDAIADTFGNLGTAIANAISTNNFDPVFDVIQTGLVAGIFLTLKKAIGGGLSFDLGGGALKNVSKSLDVLRGSLSAIQQNIKANTLLQISIAVGLLSAAVVALSLVKPDKLASAMTAITVGLGQLMGAMFLINKIGGSGGLMKMPVIAASLILLAGAINTLAIAVLILSRLSWEELAKGLGGVSALLVGISLAVKPLSKATPGMIAAGVGITAIGIAMNTLAIAAKIFATMSWEEIGKGLVGIAGALVAVGAAIRLVPPSVLLIGPGLIALGVALTAIGGAVKIFGSMDLATLGKGIGGIAAGLVAIGLAMSLMPPTLPITAAGLILVGIALGGIAGSIALMGNMDFGTLAKGIGAIAAALLVLAAGLTAMVVSLPGAAALAVAAGALALLAPTLGILGKMSWGTILKGLGTVILALVSISVAGVVAAPGLIALGAALVVVGAGLTLVSTAVYLLVKAITKMAGQGAKGVGVTIAALTAFVAILPKIIINFIKGLVEIVAQIAKVAPAIVDSMVKIISSLVEVVIKAAPRMAVAAVALIKAFLTVLNRSSPGIIKAGWKLLLNLLKGVSKNIGNVTKTVADIVIKFLRALTTKMPQITTAGASLLAAFLKGIAKNISKVANAAFDIIVQFIKAIGRNLARVVTAGGNAIAALLRGIAGSIGKVIRAGTDIIIAFVRGIGNAGARVVRAGVSAATKFINALAREIPRLVNNVASAIIRMLNRLAVVIERRTPEFIGALANIGRAFVRGIISGLDGLGGKLLSKIKSEIKSLPGKGLKLVTKAIGKVAKAVGPVSDDMAAALIAGTKFTATVKGMLSIFESQFIRQIIKLREDNIRLLFNLGNDVGVAMYDGLLSGIKEREVDTIGAAFSDIVKQISGNQDDLEKAVQADAATIKQANRDIKQDWKDLKEARKKKDSDAAQSALNSIKQHKQERTEARKSRIANEELLKILRDTAGFILTDPSLKQWANDLGAQRTLVTELNKELEIQTEKLTDLQNQRQSLFDQTFDRFATLPGLVAEDEFGRKIDPAVQVQNYISSLSSADDTIGVFTNSMRNLAGLGLNSDTYQQLLDVGPAAQDFVNELIRLGPGAVSAINAANSDLRNAASILANESADQMYKAGIDTTNGLVEGLKVKISDAIKTAEDIARAIVKAIKKRLRIKSPSEVFAQIGKQSVQGMARGFAKTSSLVTSAVSDVADDALSAMKRSMRNISDIVTDTLDPNPTITPVLDLSQIQRDANQMGSMLNVVPISAAASFGQASAISASQALQRLSETGQAEAAIKFEQNNYSPKALSEIDIYRQTRNQLSQARAVLANA